MGECRQSDVIDVDLERQSAIEDDTLSLDLRGGGCRGVVDGDSETVGFCEGGSGADE